MSPPIVWGYQTSHCQLISLTKFNQNLEDVCFLMSPPIVREYQTSHCQLTSLTNLNSEVALSQCHGQCLECIQLFLISPPLGDEEAQQCMRRDVLRSQQLPSWRHKAAGGLPALEHGGPALLQLPHGSRREPVSHAYCESRKRSNGIISSINLLSIRQKLWFRSV